MQKYDKNDSRQQVTWKISFHHLCPSLFRLSSLEKEIWRFHGKGGRKLATKRMRTDVERAKRTNSFTEKYIKIGREKVWDWPEILQKKKKKMKIYFHHTRKSNNIFLCWRKQQQASEGDGGKKEILKKETQVDRERYTHQISQLSSTTVRPLLVLNSLIRSKPKDIQGRFLWFQWWMVPHDHKLHSIRR